MRYHRKSAAVFIAAVAVMGLLAACGRGGEPELSETNRMETGLDGQPEIPVITDGGAGQDQETPTEAWSGGAQGKTEAAGQARELWDGRYFKSGDFTYQLRITPGDAKEPESPILEFSKKDAEWSDAYTSLHCFRLESRAADGTYTLKDTISGQEEMEFTIDWKWNGPVVLHGDMEEAGTYYSYDANLRSPELFDRPFNETDLIGLTREEIKIMRNQFYAVYGRAFTTPEMKTYFEGQTWYQPRIAADSFDEGILRGLERRNIDFLKSAEDSYDETHASETEAAYDALQTAPYRNLLPERGEIYVELYSDSEHTADRGIFYEAEGSIAVPIRITREEYLALEDGKTLELVSDELTGKISVLKKAEDTQYGDYVLMDRENQDENTASYVFLSYEPFSQTFSMWENSADTIFKKVYEGSIYVLKGACEEWYNYFSLQERPEGAGAFRVMEFDEVSPYDRSPYRGNVLITDGKGYVKALYFMGD